MNVDKTYLKIIYNNKNITKDISQSLISFNFTDNLNEADTLDIELEDSQCRWQSEWYPEKGAKLEATIGIEGSETINCGTFEIDEIELKSPPDSVNIRCISAGFVEGEKRTPKSHVHENKTLSEIVHTVASLAGLEVLGKISNIRVGRFVQRKETNLETLRKLANMYGYTFNVRDKKAIFIKNTEIENNKVVMVFDKTDLINFSFRDKSTGIYKLAQISYFNPETGETIKHTESQNGVKNSSEILELTHTAETKSQAIEMTKSALREANKLQQTGSITLPGSIAIISGNTLGLRRLGRFSGDYVIKSASHTISNSEGWLVNADIYKIGYTGEGQTTKNTKKSSVNFNFKGDFAENSKYNSLKNANKEL